MKNELQKWIETLREDGGTDLIENDINVLENRIDMIEMWKEKIEEKLADDG